MRTRLLVLLFAAALVSSAMVSPRPPNVNVVFTASITAFCSFDLDSHPQEISMVLRTRQGSSYPVVLNFKEKTVNRSGGIAYTFEGKSSFPPGDYDTQWPDAKFVARVWRYKNGVPGYYRDTPQCASRDRKDATLESTIIATRPATSFLGFPEGTSSKVFNTYLMIPGTFQPPDAACPDIGCR